MPPAIGVMIHSMLNVVLFMLIFIGGGVIFGLLIGRWWALLAPPALGLILFDREEAPGNDLAGIELMLAGIVEVGVLIGVLLRKLASASDDHVAPS